jgi:hypothetical protein
MNFAAGPSVRSTRMLLRPGESRLSTALIRCWIMFALADHSTASPLTNSGGTTCNGPRILRSALGEGPQVDVDQGVAGEEGGDATEGEERAERNGFLAGRGALAGDHGDADDAARQ